MGAVQHFRLAKHVHSCFHYCKQAYSIAIDVLKKIHAVKNIVKSNEYSTLITSLITHQYRRIVHLFFSLKINGNIYDEFCSCFSQIF